MDYTISPREIEEMKEFLRQHPINHEWDEEAEMLDGVLPEAEYQARTCYRILKRLGEMD